MHVIDGATGSVTAVTISTPLFASFDGRGDDLARVDSDDAGIRLEVLDGRTRTVLFGQTFPRAQAISAIPTYPGRAKRADLLLGVDGTTTGTAAVLSPTGILRWSVARPEGRV